MTITGTKSLAFAAVVPSVAEAQQKRCSKCERVLPLAAFHKNASRRDGLSAWCRGCNAKWQKNYDASRATDPLRREARRTWNCSEKNKAASRQRHGTEKSKAQARKHNANRKGAIAAAGAERLAILKQRCADPTLPVLGCTSHYRVADCAISRPDGLCVWCNVRKATSVDHEYPVRHPLFWDCPEQCIASCLPCQRSRGAKSVEQWMLDMPGSTSFRLLTV